MISRLIPVCLCLGMVGCSTEHLQSAATLDTGNEWVVLPFRNHSQTPLAAERVESLVLSALRANGMHNINSVTFDIPATNNIPLLDDGTRYNQGLEIARSQRADYGVTGAVEEWRYKTGLDGEPAVGITLRIVDLQSGAVVWSSSAARSGWSRESLTGNGQKVIDILMSEMFEKSLWTRLNVTR